MTGTYYPMLHGSRRPKPQQEYRPAFQVEASKRWIAKRYSDSSLKSPEDTSRKALSRMVKDTDELERSSGPQDTFTFGEYSEGCKATKVLRESPSSAQDLKSIRAGIAEKYSPKKLNRLSLISLVKNAALAIPGGAAIGAGIAVSLPLAVGFAAAMTATLIPPAAIMVPFALALPALPASAGILPGAAMGAMMAAIKVMAERSDFKEKKAFAEDGLEHLTSLAQESFYAYDPKRVAS